MAALRRAHGYTERSCQRSPNSTYALQALEAAQTAVQRFEAAGLAWQRPADYYAGACSCRQLRHGRQAAAALPATARDTPAAPFTQL